MSEDIMTSARRHISFWLCYFLFCYVSDIIVEPHTSFAAEVVFFISQNLYLFYGLLYFLNSFSSKTRRALVLSIFRIVLIISVFFPVRYILRYVVLSNYVNPEFGKLGINEWFVNGILWIVNYFFFALAYYYFISSLNKEKQIAKMYQEKLEKDKEQLELHNSLLRAQINPHFLYNSLNYIYAKSLPLSAELADAIMKLSEIMRYSLEQQDGDGFVQLTAEVKHIHNVIDMARLRYSHRIFLDLTVSQNLDGIKVLPFALVTLVENVLKHGTLNDQLSPAVVSIEKSSANEFKFYTWNKKRIGPKETSTSIGLKNTVRRLEEVYGKRCTITIDDGPDSFQTNIRLPLSPVT